MGSLSPFPWWADEPMGPRQHVDQHGDAVVYGKREVRAKWARIIGSEDWRFDHWWRTGEAWPGGPVALTIREVERELGIAYAAQGGWPIPEPAPPFRPNCRGRLAPLSRVEGRLRRTSPPGPLRRLLRALKGLS